LTDNNIGRPVFYQDEVDIHFGSKIGVGWGSGGEQRKLSTLGQNNKHCPNN
jgi:hypothetical protein